jgi:hypothetical protein
MLERKAIGKGHILQFCWIMMVGSIATMVGRIQFGAAGRAARWLAVAGLSVFGGGGGTVWGQEVSPVTDIQAEQGKQEVGRTAG